MRMLIACGFLLSLASLGADEPAPLVNLRKSYEAAVLKAVQPLAETYLRELRKLHENYSLTGDQAAATAIQKEIDMEMAKMSRQAPVKFGSRVAVLSATAEIAANSVDGYKLCPLRKGDVLTLTYASGLWKNNGNIPTDNPDAAQTERGDATRLAITEPPHEGMPGAVIQMIPSGTQDKPFTYTVLADVADARLRIVYGGTNPKAPGAVSYKVKVVR